MDEKITLEIRTRLDQLFSSYPASRELTELKEEMVADLTEAVAEKVNDGMTTTDAIDAAMDQLGDIDSLLKEVSGSAAAGHSTADQTDTEDDAAADTIQIDNDGDDVTIGGKNGLHIHGDRVSWRGKTLVDEDRVNFGKLVQVDGDKVNVMNGLVQVDGDKVRIAGMGSVMDTHDQRRAYVESLKLVNTRSFGIADLTSLVLDYPDATVKVGVAAGKDIVINEYMSRDNPRYFLRADQSNHHLEIHQGDRPRLWPLHARAEVFIPSALTGKLRIEAGNGSLEISDLKQDLAVTAHATNGSVRAFADELPTFTLRATNGSLKLSQVQADQLNVESQNGPISVKESRGHLSLDSHNGSVRVANFTGDGAVKSHNGTIKVDDYVGQLDGQTANGTIVARNLTGGGNLHAHHGSIDLSLAELTSDLHVEGAGNVHLTLADQVAYQFDVATRHGNLHLPHQIQTTLNDDQHKTGTVGENPQNKIWVTTSNGNVHLA